MGLATIAASSEVVYEKKCQQSDSIPDIEIARDLTTMTADELRKYKLHTSHHIAFVGDGEKAHTDSVAATIALFYVDQFRQFEDPLAPYFLLMSRNAKLALGIGGAIRMRGWADFDGSVPVNGFIPYMIPVPKNPDMRRRIGGTPGGTALFFQVVGRNHLLGDIIGFIQCDFSGPDNVIFKLKKAYVTISDWTIGWAPTTFSDPAAQAPTIDGAGQNGKISHTTLLVRWLHNFKKNWAIAASLELPQSNVDADGVMTRKLNDYLPDVAVFGQYQWSNNQHVRLSGIVRALPYRDLVDMRQHTEIGWGLQLSSVIYPTNRLAIYAMASTGKGYQSYMSDLSIGSYDLVADATPGRMYAPLALGLNLGAKYNFTPNVYATVALGRVSYHPDYNAKPSEYRYGLYGSACLFWDLTARLQTGIEYLHGSRHNFNGEHASANRIDILFQFSF